MNTRASAGERERMLVRRFSHHGRLTTRGPCFLPSVFLARQAGSGRALESGRWVLAKGGFDSLLLVIAKAHHHTFLCLLPLCLFRQAVVTGVLAEARVKTQQVKV
jgi:hypothetical protein